MAWSIACSPTGATTRRLGERIAQAQERIVTIQRELVRLATWDGQPTYDAALSELSAINATFAAEEERERAERAGPAAQREDAPTHQSEATPPAPAAAPEEVALADILLALARQERAEDGWNTPPTPFPPATESLAWMAAEVERCAESATTAVPVRDTAVEHEPARVSRADAAGAAPGRAPIQFGDAVFSRCAGKLPASAVSQGEAQQLPLF